MTIPDLRTGLTITRFALGIATASLAGPAAAHCPDGGSQRVVAELLFGRNIADRPGVSESAFRRFLDAEVTPRFPDGFTLLDTYGQFRAAGSSRIVKESGKYLMIALADAASEMTRVREIADAYKRRFRQQSVAIITRPSCVSF